MNPGRELDALVAEKVMQWDRKRIDLSDFYIAENGAISHDIPAYSTDIAAAWTVVEKMKSMTCNRGSTAILDINFFGDKDVWEVNFTSEAWASHTHDPLAWASSSTAPHAICLAALKAIQFFPRTDQTPT